MGYCSCACCSEGQQYLLIDDGFELLKCVSYINPK